MGYLQRGSARVGGRRVVLALGASYVAVGAGLSGTAIDGILIDVLLVVLSGLVLFYAGYWLPRTDVRPDLYDVVASWCLRAVGIMFGIVLLGLLADSLSDPLAGFVVLPALASVAGLGMGYHDARARTRALDAEERQREAERYSRELERYQTIVETVNDGIFVLDGDAHFTLVNDAYTELVGYDREELLGSPASTVAAEETDVAEMSEKIRRDLLRGTAESETYASTIVTASGEPRDAESTVAPLPEQDDADDEDDVSRDKVVVVRDVTERNERERRLERQNERLERFASLLAHELRNPVTIGQIYSQQLPVEADSEAVEYVTEAFDRIENMIDVMLVVTRGREAVSESVPVRLDETAREAWEEVDAPEATLVVDVDRTIKADETYVRHLFRNLFENAVEHGSTSRQPPADDAVEHGSANSRSHAHEDAVEHGSTSNRPEVDDAVERGGSDVTVTVGDLPTGFYVADDGCGIPADDRDAVFQEGYTTAGSSGGMGLGLTFVSEMAEVYEWECSVTESASDGARFEFEDVSVVRNAAD